MLSKKALEEFAEIWREEIGTSVSDKELETGAVALLTVFNDIYKPVKREWLNDYEKKYGAHITKSGDLCGLQKSEGEENEVLH